MFYVNLTVTTRKQQPMLDSQKITRNEPKAYHYKKKKNHQFMREGIKGEII